MFHGEATSSIMRQKSFQHILIWRWHTRKASHDTINCSKWNLMNNPAPPFASLFCSYCVSFRVEISQDDRYLIVSSILRPRSLKEKKNRYARHMHVAIWKWRRHFESRTIVKCFLKLIQKKCCHHYNSEFLGWHQSRSQSPRYCVGGIMGL